MPCGISSHFVATTLLWCFFVRLQDSSAEASVPGLVRFSKLGPKTIHVLLQEAFSPKKSRWELRMGARRWTNRWTQQISGENHPVFWGGPWIISCVHFYVGGWLHKLCIVMQDHLLSHYSSHGFTHTTWDYQTPKQVLLKVGCSLQVSKWPWRCLQTFVKHVTLHKVHTRFPAWYFAWKQHIPGSSRKVLQLFWLRSGCNMNMYSQAALKTRATREEHKTPANTRYQIPNMPKDPMVVTTCMNYDKIVVYLYTYILLSTYVCKGISVYTYTCGCVLMSCFVRHP